MADVVVVGASGYTGALAAHLLWRHPWFELSWLAASERSANQSYGEALRDKKSGARRWFCDEEPEDDVQHQFRIDGSTARAEPDRHDRLAEADDHE